MKNYSINPNHRVKIYIIIAIISVVIATVIPYFQKSIMYKFAAPSVVMIYYFLYNLFDKYIWKLYFISNIPNLNGYWKGQMLNSLNQNSPLELRIKQTWSKIDVVFEGSHTISQLVVANIDIKNPDAVILKYIYSVKGKTIDRKDAYGEGTQEFRLIKKEGNRYLEGTYYSSKYRGGIAKVEFISTD